MTPEKILSIPVGIPGKLFTQDNVKEEYRKLAMEWHPDKCSDPKAADVFFHITQLFNEAENQLKLGNWVTPNEYMVVDRSTAKKYVIRYRVKYNFELGEMLIGDSVVAYIIDDKHKALFNNGVSRIEGFKFKNKGMEKEMSRFLPTIKANITTRNNKHVLVIEKTKDLLLLRDVLNHFDELIEAKSAAWILSRLHNMLCYLQYSGVTHNDISLDTCFISPKHHGFALLGGWWYSMYVDKKWIGLPSYSYKLMPNRRKQNEVAFFEHDSELLRLIGRSILGDPFGTRLVAKGVPQQFADWVRLPGSGNAIKDYKMWGDVLTECWGKRKFIKMPLTADNLYVS